MGVSSGFFDSVDNDRLYDASHLNRVLNGMITEGIFQKIGNAFAPSLSGNSVVIGTGRAYLNNLWIVNDANLVLNPEANTDATNPRMDAVVFKVNVRNTDRYVTIKIITGTASASGATYPTLTWNAEEKDYPICFFQVAANSSTIVSGSLVDRRGLLGNTYNTTVDGALKSNGPDGVPYSIGLINSRYSTVAVPTTGWTAIEGAGATNGYEITLDCDGIVKGDQAIQKDLTSSSSSFTIANYESWQEGSNNIFSLSSSQDNKITLKSKVVPGTAFSLKFKNYNKRTPDVRVPLYDRGKVYKQDLPFITIDLFDMCTIDLSPLNGLTGNINWGDGVINTNKSHSYADGNMFKIKSESFLSVYSIGDNFINENLDILYLKLNSLKNVTSIGNYFLYYCSWLSVIDLSSLIHLTSIGSNFLEKCFNTNILYLPDITPPTLNAWGANLNSSVVIHCGSHLDAYKTASVWSEKASLMVV